MENGNKLHMIQYATSTDLNSGIQVPGGYQPLNLTNLQTVDLNQIRVVNAVVQQVAPNAPQFTTLLPVSSNVSTKDNVINID